MQGYPLLQTKLHIPPVRPELVSRPRLIERLNEGLRHGQGFGRKLTLVSAPAGFGKTTLVSEWIAVCQRPVAWLSLDERDNDLARFLTYLVAALQTLVLSPAEGLDLGAEQGRAEGRLGGIGQGVLGLLQAPEVPPTEAILTVLVNEVSTFPYDFILVLDDYHLIDAKPVDASTSVEGALTFLLEHLPPQMHLVIATREDPDLPLARYRARGQMTEVRISDLRFTPAEAAEFFNRAMGLGLSAGEVASLETRTEGWIAGLQLAALALQGLASQGTLSMRGREDVSGFIEAFAGDNRYIVDYLVEEVLQRQPEGVRHFLLQTSILERLSGPLCDTVCRGKAATPNRSEGAASPSGTAVRFGEAESPVTSCGTAVRFGEAESPAGQGDGRGMLEALERGNLFVVPLDDKRQWYRYHHLFADCLQARLMEEQADQVAILHQRASAWYWQHDLPADAVRHALAAEDFERAADLAELAWPAWSGSFQSITWLGWLKTLPDEVVRARPVLCVAVAWAFLNAGKLEAAGARLRDAERWLEPAPDERERGEAPPVEARPGPSRGMVVVDEEQFRFLPVSLATARAYHAQATGDLPATVRYAQRVLDLAPEGDSKWRADATALLALAYWASGELEAAHRTLSAGLAGMNRLDLIVGTFVLAEIKTALGQLHEAIRTCEHALQLAMEHGEPMPLGTEDVYIATGELHRQRGDLEAAARDLATARRLGEQVELPDWQYRWCLAQARLKESLGDLDGALDLLEEAERVYVRTPLPKVRPIAARKTQIWVAQGRLAEALGWARARGLSVDDELGYLREFEHMTLARVLIARYKKDRVDGSIHEALGLLARLLKAAEEGRRTGSIIDILVLQALAHQALALEVHGDLDSALDPLKRALTLADPEGYVRVFVDEGPPMAALLREAAVHSAVPNYVRRLRAAFGKGKDATPAAQPLIEPLSKRELEVLALLATERSGPEIARELVVSLNTLRSHTKNIYGKLGVNSRRAAVRRAQELDLL